MLAEDAPLAARLAASLFWRRLLATARRMALTLF